MEYQLAVGKYAGKIVVPASKSDAQRALLIASLGNETSVLHGVGQSKDERSILHCIEQMGAIINKQSPSVISIQGNFQYSNFSNLNCGESGLGLRMLTSICSLKHRPITIDGEGTLKTRNQNFFNQFLPQFGVKIQSNDARIPIQVEGPLKPGEYVVDGSESSQYISGLLIALSQIEGDSVLEVKNLTSRPYVDMTIQTLQKFGVEIQETKPAIFNILGNQIIKGIEYTVDGDWSSASFWLVASALGLDIKVSGLSMGSKQADKAILNALMLANCRINLSDEGIAIEGKDRKSVEFDATHCPDLFPALTTYAALTKGTSRIKGVHRLMNKESNRAEALISEFGKLGVQLFIEEDTLVIEGENGLKSVRVDAHNDHRIAMCLAIAGIVSKNELIISGAESVEKSYPSFWEDLEKCRKSNL